MAALCCSLLSLVSSAAWLGSLSASVTLRSLISTGQVITEEKIQEAKLFYLMHFRQSVFDEEGWRKVLEV